MVRVLLPFTHGIDSVAITSALALAQRLNATLMLLSLISQPQKPGKSPRWEAIQQSRDFLTFASHRATRLGVPVEQVELYTQLASRSIRTFAQEMECAGIVLTVRGGAGVLLATHEVKQLLEERGIPLYVVSLPGRPTVFSALSWLPQWLGRKTPHAASPHHVLRRQTLSCQTDHQLHDSTVLKDS